MLQMKNSGVEWIGSIPENWNVERLQWHLYEINDKNNPIKSTEVLSLTNKRGVIPYEEKGAQGNISKENYAEYNLAYKDTIVANSMNILIGSVGYSNFFGCVSPVYYVFKEKKGTSLRFINYIMQTTQFQKELRKFANGILEIRMRVSVDDIFKRKIAIPTLQEQENIANFLDKKCGEIDGLISDIEREIETLSQYKKSIITETVTKGLNKDITLKNSGIEWAKQIPEHWEVSRIANVYKLRNQKVSDKDFEPLSVTMKGIFPQWENVAKSDAHDDRKLVRKGDFAINSRSDRRGSCGISDRDGSVSLINLVLQPLTNMNPNYYNWLFHTESFADEFYKWGHGIVNDLWTTNWQDMKRILIPQPPIQEQREIAEYLDKKCKEIDSILEDKNKQLEILESYKKSIIYEYVTGKKEVVDD